MNFSGVNTTATDAAVKVRFVKDLASFVRGGLCEYGDVTIARRVAAPVDAILARLADSLLSGVDEGAAPDQARVRVVSAFLADYLQVCQARMREDVPPVPITLWPEEEELIAERFGRQAEGGSLPFNVDGAVEMSWRNLRRAQQRLVAWSCLGKMLCRSLGSGDGGGESPQMLDYEAVSSALLEAVNRMKRRMLAVSLVAGGAAAERAREWVVRTMFGAGMSIMEYMEPDGVVPSRWSADDELALRASLAAAWGAPAGLAVQPA
ncbi:hypothetical protein [Rubrivivax gelatinosus]|uniref:hypothetical protein n=1 Tax=Rubrivivax gelatinosus TaxID=28068 RepID=UPI0005C12E3B|nr:hypothetical protein [Rubrivivax gelatinosus]MBG6083143.1 hypothetical protein [Rubrivivax gelatinosus]